MSVLPLVTTPRSGADLPCQILPQRTYEEVQQLYGASLFYVYKILYRCWGGSTPFHEGMLELPR